VGLVSDERVEARRVSPDQRLVEGVKAGGGQPGSNVGKGSSMPVDMHVDVEPIQRGWKRDYNSLEDIRDGRSGEI
jgi:hypothetical protein